MKRSPSVVTFLSSQVVSTRYVAVSRVEKQGVIIPSLFLFQKEKEEGVSQVRLVSPAGESPVNAKASSVAA